MYDYPGGYDDKAIGDRLTKVRQEAERIFEDRCTAGGYAPSLTPGFAIQRTSQDGDSQDDDYLILRCNHWYGDQSYASTASGQEAADGAYSGSYELSRFSVPYRMPLRTRRPVIIGSQPAKVISKQNQEIDVDKQGRVLVEFYWDDTTGSSAPKKTPSRRVRVGQIWAGLNRGALFIPRVGDEVMVEYENGDPDRPIIVGSVYNGTSENPGNLVSLTLPDKKTMSGVLGKSSTDGGSTIHNANAWWFDDSKGSEQFLVRARKDLYFRAYNNQNIRIGANVTETVGGDETINVGPVDEEGAKVGGSNAGGNFTLNAFQSITLNVGPKDAPPLTQIKMDQDEHHAERRARRLTCPNQDGCERRHHQRHSDLATDGATERHHNNDAHGDGRFRTGHFRFAIRHDSHRRNRRRHYRRRDGRRRRASSVRIANASPASDLLPPAASSRRFRI